MWADVVWKTCDLAEVTLTIHGLRKLPPKYLLRCTFFMSLIFLFFPWIRSLTLRLCSSGGIQEDGDVASNTKI